MNTINARKIRGTSLERGFVLRWATFANPPELDREYMFAAPRKWRFDFAHIPSRTAIEIDGGMHRGGKGGHTSMAGATRDREKDFAAARLGWQVIRLTPKMSKERQRLWEIIQIINVRTP